MEGRFASKIERLRSAVLEGSGELDPEVRGAAYAGEGVPEPFALYLDKIARHAYKVTDGDVEALRAAGYSEDEIFEATVSAALGAGLRRLEIGLGAIR